MSRIVIVGAGHAGVQAAFSLRESGFPGEITIVNDEAGLPYQRPPLSKSQLIGTAHADDGALRPSDHYVRHHVELLAGRVVGLDRGRRRAHLDDGLHLSYDTLIIATGASPRRLTGRLASDPPTGVLSLHTRADADRLRDALGSARRMVILGAGPLGLEVAAAARQSGVATTIVERGRRVLARSVTPLTSEAIANTHRRWGTSMRLGRSAVGLLTSADGTRGRRISGVTLDDTSMESCDLLLLAAGVMPNQELARSAGLRVTDGILVDHHLKTSDPAIYAIGGCARFPAQNGAPIRLGSTQNAADHARYIANHLTHGGDRAGDDGATGYSAVPWVWSQQGTLNVQITGLTPGHDSTVIVGDPAIGEFSVLCFRGDQLLGVESTNRPLDHIAARRILSGSSVRLTPSIASAPDFELCSFASMGATFTDVGATKGSRHRGPIGIAHPTPSTLRDVATAPAPTLVPDA